MNFTNVQVTTLLRNIAAAYQLKSGNRFQIAAYESAASAIEHATTEVKDLWEQGNLGEIPGIGKGIEAHLDELFRTGRVKHFQEVFKGIPEEIFPLLEIPGVGPKTAVRLVGNGVCSIADLERRIKQKTLISSGWSQKKLEDILSGIESLKKRERRMLLPYASTLAEKMVAHLKQCSAVKHADALGSLRRHVATVGDIDIAVASTDPEAVLDHFLTYPRARKVERGERDATMELPSGVRVDLLVQEPKSYGATLQHFTGSKQHNIHLRSIAQKKGFSLSEYGITEVKGGRQHAIAREDEVYTLLGMHIPPPELREDTGEIEAAVKHTLPSLVTINQIRGDLHLHTMWSDGVNTAGEMIGAAEQVGYEYIALTDHSYPSLDVGKRSAEITRAARNAKIKVLIGLEVNIDMEGNLQVSDEVLARVDLIIAAIHTGFRQEEHQITKRLLAALEHPKVTIIAHPTGRILLEREGYEADWEEVFKACKRYGKALEINAYPNRLDLPDTLVRRAVEKKIPLVINTDAHDITHLAHMSYGVGVARRGWAQTTDILNTLPFKQLCDRLNL